MKLRRPSFRPRLLPLTLFGALLLLAVKLSSVVSAVGGLSESTSPIAVAHASSPAPGKPTPGEPAKATAGEPAKADAGHGASTEADKPAAEAPAKRQSQLQPVCAGDGTPPPSPAEIAILQQLTERREAIDARAQDLDRRQDLIAAADARLDQKVAQMQKLEATLQSLLKDYDAQEEAKLRSLVKIYETMKPKDAARIFEQLDQDTLLPVVDRMSERKLAPVLASMDSAKAKAVTEELARLRKLVTAASPANPG